MGLRLSSLTAYRDWNYLLLTLLRILPKAWDQKEASSDGSTPHMSTVVTSRWNYASVCRSVSSTLA